MASKRGLYYDIMQKANEVIDEMSRDDIDDRDRVDIAYEGLGEIYHMGSYGHEGRTNVC